MAFADFQALYKQKLTTADEAVKVIKSGDWVDYGFCAIHPRVLDEALARRAPELEDVKVRGGISLWKPAIFDIEDPVHHIIFNSHHMSSVERHHIASGAGFHEPMRYSELPRYYYDHITPPDVAMFQVAPMDKHGYFNFGLSASHVKAVCEMAKVVIVDADMRKPVLHKIFRVSNNNGLSKLLSGLIKPEDCINKSIMPNLDLINAGPIPPNPSELLGSERMAGLLQTLSASYDYIFLDAPPINVVADSLMFLDKTAGAILVARQKQTHYDELQKAAESIRNLHSSVLGVVITDVSETNKPYAMYKSYKYKSYDYEYKKV